MSKIERYSNWCEYDQLDGVELYDGENLSVTFPNGKVIELKAYVRSSSYEVSDHGHLQIIPVTKAYHKSFWAGVPIKIPLLGLEAKRIKGESHGKKEE